MTLVRQTAWGWLIALYIFFVGTGAGVFVVGFVVSILGPMKNLGIVCTILGPILLIFGLTCLLLDMIAPIKRCHRLLFGLSTSWMSRGLLIQLLFILFGLGYALPGFWIPWWSASSGFVFAIGGIAFILALITATYHGLLFGSAKAIPIWSSPMLPMLSLFVSLCTGVGLVLLISVPFAGFYPEGESRETFNLLAFIGMPLLIIELISLIFLVSIKSGTTYSASINKLKLPLIISAVLSIICMTLLASGLTLGLGRVVYLFWISSICGILLLATGYILRSAIIKGGYRYSLQIPF
jgi:formate-dependent nitrite reductase membrane component NrfD